MPELRPDVAGKGLIHWPWRNNEANRRKASRAVDQLHQRLLQHCSATLVLEEWCRLHGISAHPPSRNGSKGTLPTAAARQGPNAAAAVITARQTHVRGQPGPRLSDEGLALLNPLPGERIAYRHVHLVFDGATVSKADNWYVVSRLEPGMDEILTTTETPFGKVVKSLACRRRTIWSRRWFPATAAAEDEQLFTQYGPSMDENMKSSCQANGAGKDISGAGGINQISGSSIPIPDDILEIRAIVCRGDDGRVLCYVREQYQSKLMDFSADTISN